jgi:hypothetical protein
MDSKCAKNSAQWKTSGVHQQGSIVRLHEKLHKRNFHGVAYDAHAHTKPIRAVGVQQNSYPAYTRHSVSVGYPYPTRRLRVQNFVSVPVPVPAHSRHGMCNSSLHARSVDKRTDLLMLYKIHFRYLEETRNEFLITKKKNNTRRSTRFFAR